MNAQHTIRQTLCALARTIIIASITLLPNSSPPSPWQIYTLHDNTFTPLLPISQSPLPLVSPSPCPPASLPPSWQITAAALADVTHDGITECVLLAWRPWRDWPIQQWLPVPSPIAGFHDAAGNSCHLILLDPHQPDGREIWAGSALPAPLLAMAVGDVDRDGRNEIVTLEGVYAVGRDGPATHVNVWRWNDFGFTLEHRSPARTLYQLRLTDADNDGILNIIVR